MSRLLESLLDPERRAQCAAADDLDIAREREGQRHRPPYWMFGPRTETQLAIRHPAAARRSGPAPSRFGDLA